MKRPRPDDRWTSCSVISELLGARAEHSDHELAGAVDRAAHGRAGADRVGGIDRRLHRDIGPAPDPDHADLLAGRDRRPDRAAIDHARDQLLVDVFRHHHLDRLRARKPDRATVAAKHFCVADRLVGGEQRAGLEIAKTPFQHLLGLGGAVVRVFQAVDHDDQPGVVLHGGADHAVAALLGVAGLQAVGARHRIQQWIAVLLPDLVPSEFLLAEQFVHVRVSQDDVAREPGQFPHRHLVAGVGQPVGIAEGRFGQTQLAGALGHEVAGKGALVAGHALGERDAGIIAALDDGAMQEIVDRDL